MNDPAHRKLNAWLKANAKPGLWLAEQLGCSQPTASRIATGAGRPSPERAVKIEKITKGAVKAMALLTDPLAANDTPHREAA